MRVRHFHFQHVPALFPAGALRAAAEAQAADLRLLAQAHQRQPGFGQALAARFRRTGAWRLGARRQLGQGDGDGLGQIVAFQVDPAQHHRQAAVVRQRGGDSLQLGCRAALVARREMVHEPVRTEEHEGHQQQHADFEQRAARAEPFHGGRREGQRGEGGAGHDQRQLPAVADVDQQQHGVEHEHERQDGRARRVGGPLDAGLDRVFAGDRGGREGGQAHRRRDVRHDAVIEHEHVHGDQGDDQPALGAQFHHHRGHQRRHQDVVGRRGHAQAQNQAHHRREYQHQQHVAHRHQFDERRHPQSQARQGDGADDQPRGAAGDGDADHVARAFLQAADGVAPSLAPGGPRRLLAEPRDQRTLRDHLEQHRHRGPERRQARRQFLHAQAPDQDADGDQEVQPGAHGGPGLRPHRVIDVDVLRQVGMAGRDAQQPQVERRQDGQQHPGGGGARHRLYACADVVDRAHHHQGAADAHAPTRQLLQRRADRAGSHHGLDAELQGLQVDDVEERDVGDRGRQDRVADDVGIGDADVFDHQEGGRAHDGRHDLAIDRRGGLDRARAHAAVAGLFHEGNREDAARHHVGHRRRRHQAVDGGGHHGHLGRAAAQVAQQRERDLHHVVAGAALVQHGAQQHEDEDVRHRHAQRHAVDALGGQPHVGHQAFQRRAPVRQHVGQPGAGQRVGDEHQAQHRHGQAQRAARHFQQQRQPDDGRGHVHRRGLPGAAGQFVIEQVQIAAAEGRHQRQRPVVPGHAVARGALAGRIRQVPQEHGDAQVQRARLGVVENSPVQRERQRGCVPELEHGPDQRARGQRGARDAADVAASAVGVGDQLFEVRGRRMRLFCHEIPLRVMARAVARRALCPCARRRRARGGSRAGPRGPLRLAGLAVPRP
ncbi:hypothetical protein D9M72_73990 [compost metagenome]